MRARDCIVVMARLPAPGSTKTRLAEALDDRTAASLYKAFLLDTLATCSGVDASLLVSYAPDSSSAERYFRSIVPTAMLTAQREVAFGARLAAAMQAAFDGGSERVAVIGSDIPHMSRASIEDAFASLDDHDMTLIPTEDGGYCLLALRAPEARLFEDIDWSTGREFGQTLERAAELELRVKTLQETFDIDDVEDLFALRDIIVTKGFAVCPKTAAALSCVNLTAFSALGVPG